MPDRPTLAASSRDVIGKKVARLRREGRLPAVVYGHGKASTPVSVDAHELAMLRRKAAGSALVDLSVDGKRAVPVVIQGVQLDPISHRPLHVDLFAVRMTEEMTAEVPLVGTGVAPAVEKGGTLVHQLMAVKVKALPANLPESIHYDLTALVDFDAVVTVGDLIVPDDVTLLLQDPTETVAKVLAPRVAEAALGETTDDAAAAEAPAAEG